MSEGEYPCLSNKNEISEETVYKRIKESLDEARVV